MRKFSDWEKDIIREIANQAQNKFAFDVSLLFHDLFYGEGIFFYNNATKCLYYNITKIAQGDLYKVEQILFDRMFLLSYLAENKYIYICLYHDKEVEVGRYGTKQNNKYNEYQEVNLPKPLILEFHKCINSWIYVSKDLFSLVENDFKEYEEIALEEAKKQTEVAKKQSRSAMWSVILSAIAVLVALLTMIL